MTSFRSFYCGKLILREVSRRYLCSLAEQKPFRTFTSRRTKTLTIGIGRQWYNANQDDSVLRDTQELIMGEERHPVSNEIMSLDTVVYSA